VSIVIGCIQSSAAGKQRRSIQLKIPEGAVDVIKVEAISSANFAGDSYDRATAEWVARIDVMLYGMLAAKAGLLAPRQAPIH
jgi:hypothetical protein